MATQGEPTPHGVTILYNRATKELHCDPALLKGVKKGDTITWSSNDLEFWAVVFGPDSPFEERVIAKEGLLITQFNKETQRYQLTGAEKATKVVARRPADFHKHKYVAIALTEDGHKACDPEVDVEE
jgi:hypothetical protein